MASALIFEVPFISRAAVRPATPSAEAGSAAEPAPPTNIRRLTSGTSAFRRW